jgi:hypothetical protein
MQSLKMAYAFSVKTPKISMFYRHSGGWGTRILIMMKLAVVGSSIDRTVAPLRAARITLSLLASLYSCLILLRAAVSIAARILLLLVL